MALGVIKIIPASSHTEFSLTGGGTSGGGNQYPAVSILNPNDGVAYVSQNRDCLGVGYGSWDWKVPSQSYALLPGPFQSVGIYYLDQSGAGRQGEITVYPSQRQFDVPLFNSIGRALQAQTTSLDVTEGVIPPNPGSGILRLWADGTDFLHLLNGAGTDKRIIDTVIAAGGGLAGTFPNPTIAPNAVDFAEIVNGAVTRFASQVLGASSTTSPTPVSSLASLNITSRNALIWIHLNWTIQMSSVSALATFSVWRDGVNLNNAASVNCKVANYAEQMCFDVFDTPSAGNHTYTIFWQVNLGSISSQPGVNGQFSLMEIAR